MKNSPPLRIFIGLRKHAEYFLLLGILILGAAIRILYFSELQGRPQFSLLHLDGKYHDQMARASIQISMSDPAVVKAWSEYEASPYFRAPGYIYFLSGIYRLLGDSYAAPRIVQFGLGLVNAFLTWWLYRRIFGSRYALWAALAAAVYWIFVYYEGTLYETTWLTFLLLLLAAALVRLQRVKTLAAAGLAGVIFAAGVITRPNLLACVLPIAGWIWLSPPRSQSRRWPHGMLVFLGAALLTIAPVTLRNYVKSGEWVLVSSNAGINLYAGNNETSNGYTPGGPLIGFWDCFDYPKLCARIGQRAGRPLTYSETSSYLAREALRYAVHHPQRTLALAWKKTLLFWGPLEVGNEEEEELERTDSRVLARLPGRFPAVMALFCVGAIMCLFRSRKKSDLCAPEQRNLGLLILLVILFYFLSHLPFIVAARYRTPLIPFQLLFAVAAAARMLDLLRNQRWRTASAWLATTGFLGLACSANFAGYEPNRPAWHTQRATRFGRMGQFDEAIAECRAATVLAPGFPEAWRLLGHAYLSQENPEQAIESYRQACRLDPLDSASRNNLACLLMERPEQLAEATIWAAEACRITAHLDPNVMNNLAECLIRQKRIAEAVDLLRRAIPVAQKCQNAIIIGELKNKLEGISSATEMSNMLGP